jgi:hypothetical protein
MASLDSPRTLSIARFTALGTVLSEYLQRHRLLVAAVIGLVIFAGSALYRPYTTSPAADMSWPLCAARAYLSGADPYEPPCYIFYNGYWQATMWPTAAYVTLPFLPLGNLAASAVFGVASALLAYGILREGPAWRLLIFTSAVYWQAFKWLQWSPLIAAVALLPWLMPLVLVKPHIGLAVFLYRFSWRRALACLAVVALTLLIDPTWPLRWWSTATTYNGYIPMLVLPLGPLLLLALSRWRTDQGRLLLLMAVVPQRASYDQTALWFIPQTLIEMLFLSFLSWASLIVFDAPTSVLIIYVGALALVLYRPLYARFSREARPADGNV